MRYILFLWQCKEFLWYDKKGAHPFQATRDAPGFLPIRFTTDFLFAFVRTFGFASFFGGHIGGTDPFANFIFCQNFGVSIVIGVDSAGLRRMERCESFCFCKKKYNLFDFFPQMVYNGIAESALSARFRRFRSKT